MRWLLILLLIPLDLLGQTRISASPIRVVQTLADLDNLPPSVDAPVVRVMGFVSPKDWGELGREFYYDRTNALATNAIRRAVRGGVGRWVHDWDGNVKVFGAKGDVTYAWMRATNSPPTPTDDTDAIQAAVDYATEKQIELFFPEGTYLLTRSITNKSLVGVKMRGTGSSVYGFRQATNNSPAAGTTLTRYHNGPYFTFLGAESTAETESPDFFGGVQWGVEVRDLCFKDAQRDDTLTFTNSAIVTRNSMLQRWNNVEFRSLRGGVFDSRLLDDSIFTNCRFTDCGFTDETTPIFLLWRQTNPTGSFQYNAQNTLTWIGCNWELNKNPAFDDPKLYAGDSSQVVNNTQYSFIGCTFKRMGASSFPQRIARFYRVNQISFTGGTMFTYNSDGHTNVGTLDAPLVFDSCTVNGEFKIARISGTNALVTVTNMVRFVNTLGSAYHGGGNVTIEATDFFASPGTLLAGDSIVYVDPLVAQEVKGAFRINYTTGNSDAYGGLPLVNTGGDDHVVDNFSLIRGMHPRLWHRVKTRGYYLPGDGGGASYVATNTVASTNNYGGRIASPVTNWSWQQESLTDVNIRTWGIMDSQSDNHTRLRTLLATQPNRVLVPEGTHHFTSEVRATNSNLTLVIAGKITGPTNSSTPLLYFGPTGFDGFTQSNIAVIGQGGLVESIGMQFRHASNVIVRGLRFTGSMPQCVRFQGTADASVSDCEFYDIAQNTSASPQQSAITLNCDTTQTNLAVRTWVRRNTFRNVYGSAFRCNGFNSLFADYKGISDIYFTDNVVWKAAAGPSVTTSCFLISYTKGDLLVERNHISSWLGVGLNISHPQRVFIRGNTIVDGLSANQSTFPLTVSTTNNTTNAKWFDRLEVIGNTFADYPGSVQIMNAEKVILANNIIRGVGTNDVSYRSSVMVRAYGDSGTGPSSANMFWRAHGNDISGTSARGLGFEYVNMPAFSGTQTVLQNNIITGFTTSLVDTTFATNTLPSSPDIPETIYYSGSPRTLTVTNLSGAAAVILKGVTP